MIELLDPTRLTPLQLGAWRDLAARAAEPNPFFDPTVVLPAVHHLPDGPRVRLLVLRRGEHWIGALPVITVRRWRRLPMACTVAWKHPFTFLGTPLLAADDLDRAAQTLFMAPQQVTPHPLLVLETVGQDGPIARALLEATDGTNLIALHHESRAALIRRPDDDYVDGHRSGKRRREARRLRHRLDDALGGPAQLQDHAASPEALGRFLALEASGWKGRASTALASDPAHVAFVRAVGQAPTTTVQSHVLELGVPERPAAMSLALLAGNTAFAVKLAYDERLAVGAPGVQLMADTASWFHHHTKVHRMDSCARPDNQTINGLWPDRHATASVVITAPGVGGVLARTSVRAYASAQRRGSSHPGPDEQDSPVADATHRSVR